MNVAIGSDRRGFDYKEELKGYLTERGYDVWDAGTYDNSFPADYPVYGYKVAEKVMTGKCDRGIVICATGIGIMIACNKVRGIRCGMGYTDAVAKLMREHNDANIIAFGQDQMSLEDVKRRTEIFLSTDFLAGYHSTRIEQLQKLDERQEIHQTPRINKEDEICAGK